jgi:oligoribonuclease (3'-5' exoribonuclease)
VEALVVRERTRFEEYHEKKISLDEIITDNYFDIITKIVTMEIHKDEKLMQHLKNRKKNKDARRNNNIN